MILFITGTDTEIGKTYVAASLARSAVAEGLRVGVYKPVASGCEPDAEGNLISEDAVALWQAAGRPESLARVCPQRFAAPLAPPAAAAAEGRTVDRQEISDGAQWWLGRCELLIVEGAGGLMSPLADDWFNADAAAELRATMVVVAPNRLGVINHTLQTLITARHYHLPVAGVILNDLRTGGPMGPGDRSIETNAAAIRRYANVPLLAEVARGGEVPPEVIERLRRAAASSSDEP